MQTIIFASQNEGKIDEVKALFAGSLFEIITQNDLGISGVEETGISFVENALIKARHVAGFVNYPVIADDSGLVVDALDGAPGVISGRYAGVNATYHDNREKLISELKKKKLSRTKASFHSLMVAIQNKNDPTPIICHGVWHGEVIDTCKGDNDFGYCPMFYVPEFKCTIGEMDDSTKNLSSHRYHAVNQIKQELSNYYQ